MKKVLLFCCLMVATHMLVFGQAAQVSKSEFTAKASQLNTLLEQNKATEAKAVWDDVHQMMMTEMTSIKYKMRDASSTNNTASKTSNTSTAKSHLADVAQKQYVIYASLLKLRDNMVQNRAAIKTKLNQFGAEIL